MFEPERDFTNSFDHMFDFDHDGKIDSLEQYAEIDFLSGGRLEPGDGDMEMAHDYFMHSSDPDLTFPSYLADEEDIEEGFARDEWGNEDGFDCDSDE